MNKKAKTFNIWILVQYRGMESQEMIHQFFSPPQVMTFMKGKGDREFSSEDLRAGAFEWRNGEQRVVYHFIPNC